MNSADAEKAGANRKFQAPSSKLQKRFKHQGPKISGMFVLAVLLVFNASAQDYGLVWSKFSCGAGSGSNGVNTLSATIGQAETTPQTLTSLGANGSYSLTAGFWSFLAPAPAPLFASGGYVWTNTAGGNWTAVTNWSPNGVPGSNDTAWITTPGNYTVALGTAASVSSLVLGADNNNSGSQTLSLAGGSLTVGSNSVVNSNGVLSLGPGLVYGNGPLTIDGTLDWSSGNIEVSNVTLNGLTTVAVGGGRTVTGMLVNNGMVNWSAGTLSVTSPGVFSNSPAGTMNITVSGIFAQEAGGTNALLANAGQWNENPGPSSLTTVIMPFNNSGAVNLHSGTLMLEDGGTSDGSFNLAVGASLELNGGTFNFLADSSVAGPGTFDLATGTLNESGAIGTSMSTIVNNGSVNFLGGSSLNGSLSVNGGILNASNGTVNVTGPMSWGGGTIEGNGTVLSSGGLTISGAGQRILSGATLANAGTATWTGGYISTSNGAFSNAPSGILNVSATGVLMQFFSGNSGLFANAGVFNANPGSGSHAQITVPFDNSGVVSNQTGTLDLNDGGVNSGSFVISGGATLAMLAGIDTFQGSSSISGPGNLTVSGGTFNESGAFSAGGTTSISGGIANFAGVYTIPGPLNLTGGTMSVSNGTFAVSGPMSWGGGTLQGSNSVVTASGGLTISGVGARTLNTVTLVNPATATWSGGYIQTSNGTFSNAPSGTLNVSASGLIMEFFSGNSGLLANAGQFNANPGVSNDLQISVPFNNSGAVSNQSGTLELADGGVNSGSFGIAGGATLNALGGINTFSAGSSVSGPGNFSVGGGTASENGTFNVGGTVTVSGGTGNFLGNYSLNGNPLVVSGGTANFSPGGTLAPAVLTVSGGTLGATDQVINVSGLMTWGGGTIQSNITINAQGGMTINGSGQKLLVAATLVNDAIANWISGYATLTSSSVFSNAPGATLNLTTDGVLMQASGGNNLFANAGQFNASPGVGNSAQFSVPVINSGIVSANSGTFNPENSYVQTAGTTLLNGGNIVNASPLQIQGGGLSGIGSVSGSVTNSATVSPGSPLGQMIIGNNYVQTASGALAIALGGTNAGNYGALTVTNTASLAGALNVSFVNGFAPPSNSVFIYLAAKTRTNIFAAFNYPSNAVLMTNIYASASASLKALTGPAAQGPLPPLTIVLEPSANVTVTWPNSGAYLLQTNNNLGATNWNTYGGAVTTTNGTNSATIGNPQGDLFFRLAP